MKDKVTDHQALLSRPTDHLDLIHDLLDALNLRCDLLSQLLLIEGVQSSCKQKPALIDITGDATKCGVRACSKVSLGDGGNVT